MSGPAMGGAGGAARGHWAVSRGFTLIELLVVIAVVAILATLLISTLQSAMDASRRAACVSNLRQIGAGIMAYAGDHEGKIPYGPTAGPYNNAGNFYPSTGAPTSLLSLQDGTPVALGLLLEKYLARTPGVLFCPGSDQGIDARKELDNVGKKQAQSSYYYRHGGNTELFDPSGGITEPPLLLGALGDNRKGKPIRALVMDTLFLCPKELKSFGVVPVSNHHEKFADIFFTDGHVSSRPNDDGRFSVDIRDFSQVRSAFSKILGVFEVADEEP